MKRISLTKGYEALIDDADYKMLLKFIWRATELPYTTYVYTATYNPNKYPRQQNISMHRMIMGMKKGDGMEVDHLDNNGLNNQRANLEVVTRSENAQRGWDRRRKDEKIPT